MPTVAEIQSRLAAYKAAELKILEGQDYTISDGAGGISRRLRRADLEQVRLVITELEAQLAAAAAEEAGVRRVLYLR